MLKLKTHFKNLKKQKGGNLKLSSRWNPNRVLSPTTKNDTQAKNETLGSNHANHSWLQVELFLQNHEKPALRSPNSPFSIFTCILCEVVSMFRIPGPQESMAVPAAQPVKLEEPYQLRKPNLPAGSVTGCATCIAKNTQQVTIRTNFMSLTDLSTSGLSALHSHSISTWTSSQSCSGP